MRRVWIEIAANLLFWVLTAWLITLGFSIDRVEHTVENGVETVQLIRNGGILVALLKWIGFAAIVFYVNLGMFLRSAPSVPIARILLKSALWLGISLVLTGLISRFGLFSDPLRLPSGLVYGVGLFYFSASLAYGIGKRWSRAEGVRKNLLLEKKQAELNLIRNQLQPHFLFNALNNLLAMVDQQRDKPLAVAIEKLSDMLRYVVYDTPNHTVPIGSEVSFVKNYCDLQKLRFTEGEIELDFQVLGSHTDRPVEPGLFVPFVENAFKHGTCPEAKAEIRIVFDLTRPDRILFSVDNLILGTPYANPSGNGILLSQKRLGLLYPEAHELRIERTGNWHKVYLQINHHG